VRAETTILSCLHRHARAVVHFSRAVGSETESIMSSPLLDPLQTAAAAAASSAAGTSLPAPPPPDSSQQQQQQQPEQEDNGSITPSPTNMESGSGAGAVLVKENQQQQELEQHHHHQESAHPPNNNNNDKFHQDDETNSMGSMMLLAEDDPDGAGADFMADQVMEMAQQADFPAAAANDNDQMKTTTNLQQPQEEQATTDPNNSEPSAVAESNPVESEDDANNKQSSETEQQHSSMGHSNSSSLDHQQSDNNTEDTDVNMDSNEDRKQAAVPPPTAKRVPDAEVIDLLDSDDEDEDEGEEDHSQAFVSKKPRLEQNGTNHSVSTAAAFASYQQRANYRPTWMKQHQHVPLQPAAATSRGIPIQPPRAESAATGAAAATVFRQDSIYNKAHFIKLPPDFIPTWKQVMPPAPAPAVHPQQRQASAISLGPKVYQLSLLNVSEFTIEGLSPNYGEPPTSIAGLRVPIRQISRKHGKSVYERDKQEGGGKWRIPLGAYHDFASYLQSEPSTTVYGIAANQLQIASLERARQEKGYPEPEQLMEYGVPKGLANALAPFQRGGVDFVKEKNGRALIADGALIVHVDYYFVCLLLLIHFG